MGKRSYRVRMIRVLMAAAVGGSAFQVSGCDPQVRSTVISGLESTTQGLATALVTALFQRFNNDGTNSASTGLTTTTP